MHSNASALRELPPASRGLRIAVVTETFPPEINGVAMTIGRTVGAMQARGHRVQLIRPRQHRTDTPARGERLEEILSRGIPIPRYQGLRLGLPAKQALIRLWSAQRPDVVHVVTEGPLGWSALAAAARLRLPLSTGFHTNFHAYSRHYGIGFLKGAISAYLRRFHNRANATMVPTDALRHALERDGYQGVRVVARGVDTRLFSPARRLAALRKAWGTDESAPVALYVGRLAPEKNLHLVVHAFDAMHAVDSRARLVWVGDGPERATLQKQHPDHVFVGMRSGEDLAAHYASCDVFLFPSLTETFGNVTLEAMASGLAVVAYDYAAAQQHIVHGENGRLARCGDADDFAGQARGLASDPRGMGGLRAAARATAETIDWEKVFADFEAVLLDTIRGRESAHA
ncbi:MAG TPA: glycosyltransferase family 1 protein [Burkholderiales bacterium]|nr:glycosyltransferase family 1 protein [Burkholderiales bacterium]